MPTKVGKTKRNNLLLSGANQTLLAQQWHVGIVASTGFSDELAFPGAVGVCSTVPTDTTDSIQHLCRVGLCHGGVQDALPAQSHQTPRLLFQLHSCECTSWNLFQSPPVFRDDHGVSSNRHLKSAPQSLLPYNSSGLDDNAKLEGVMMELLNRSVLYSKPVDPVYWWGALRKCEGRILPCLKV